MIGVKTLLKQYDETRKDRYASARLVFEGVPGKDVYNISAPFPWHGETYIAGRVETRESELSDIRFFKKTSEHTFIATKHTIPDIQDPHITRWGDTLFVGGTEFNHSNKGEREDIHEWWTAYYSGSSLSDLRKRIVAPLNMKDLRLHFTASTIHVFTRPKGGAAGLGRIGHMRTARLEEITPEAITQAPLLEDRLPATWWTGVNDVRMLKDGRLGILAHLSNIDEKGDRHYYAAVFAYDPETRKSTPMKIIATRKDFPDGPAKYPDLHDVVFPGGIIRHENSTATLYAGISDVDACILRMKDPFLEYEGYAGGYDV